MKPYLLRRLILCLISQMSGKDFAFDEDNFSWRIKNEIGSFLGMNEMDVVVDRITYDSRNMNIGLKIPDFKIYRHSNVPSNIMKSYYFLYLWLKENNMNFAEWNKLNFKNLEMVNYIHVDKSMKHDRVHPGEFFLLTMPSSRLYFPIYLFFNKDFLEILRILYIDIHNQCVSDCDDLDSYRLN